MKWQKFGKKNEEKSYQKINGTLANGHEKNYF